jgi:hypothetical protein
MAEETKSGDELRPTKIVVGEFNAFARLAERRYP